jgi:hypothetical protein
VTRARIWLWLLSFVFAFINAFEDGEPGIFGIGDGERFEFGGGIELGYELADGSFAEGTLGDRGCVDGAAQGEGAAAYFAVALVVADFVFVEGHRVARIIGTRRTQEQITPRFWDWLVRVAWQAFSLRNR